MSDPPLLCALNQPESMQLSDCVVDHQVATSSAIDEFEEALLALNRTAALLGDASHPDVLAQMLIVSVVSTTEAYLRHLFGSLVARCPIVARNVEQETLPYGAVRSYPPEVASLALLEGVMFSSQGVITKQIRRFTRYQVPQDSELSAAIQSFEVVCQIRHSAAHWRGFLDSRATSGLGIPNVEARNYRLDLSLELVQRAFAVCDYLVRLVNHTLYLHTARLWTESGILHLDDDTEAEDADRCLDLIAIFGSSAHCESVQMDSRKLLTGLIAAKESD